MTQKISSIDRRIDGPKRNQKIGKHGDFGMRFQGKIMLSVVTLLCARDSFQTIKMIFFMVALTIQRWSNNILETTYRLTSS